MAVLCLFLLLFVFMFLGVPIAISLGLSGAVSILMFSPDSVSSLAIKLFETSDAYTFLAIPFFLLSGAFMTTGGDSVFVRVDTGQLAAAAHGREA